MEERLGCAAGRSVHALCSRRQRARPRSLWCYLGRLERLASWLRDQSFGLIMPERRSRRVVLFVLDRIKPAQNRLMEFDGSIQ